jgi:hypothetical protein
MKTNHDDKTQSKRNVVEPGNDMKNDPTSRVNQAVEREIRNADMSDSRPKPDQGSAEAIGGPTIADSGLGAMEAGYTPNELEQRDADNNYSSGNSTARSDDRGSRSSNGTGV